MNFQALKVPGIIFVYLRTVHFVFTARDTVVVKDVSRKMVTFIREFRPKSCILGYHGCFLWCYTCLYMYCHFPCRCYAKLSKMWNIHLFKRAESCLKSEFLLALLGMHSIAMHVLRTISRTIRQSRVGEVGPWRLLPRRNDMTSPWTWIVIQCQESTSTVMTKKSEYKYRINGFLFVIFLIFVFVCWCEG